jgi:hypothetical protein
VPYETKGKCVYKKDSGEKVGCTDGPIEDYLAALHANVKKENKRVNITKEHLKRIIKEELLGETGYGPGGRREPGHRDPESGNWVDPGTRGYNPEKDETLHDYAVGEYEKAREAHGRWIEWGGKKEMVMGPQVDKSWKHPAFRGRRGV